MSAKLVRLTTAEARHVSDVLAASLGQLSALQLARSYQRTGVIVSLAAVTRSNYDETREAIDAWRRLLPIDGEADQVSVSAQDGKQLVAALRRSHKVISSWEHEAASKPPGSSPAPDPFVMRRLRQAALAYGVVFKVEELRPTDEDYPRAQLLADAMESLVDAALLGRSAWSRAPRDAPGFPISDKYLVRATGHLETVWATLAQGRSTGAGLISLQLQLLEHLEDGLELWREWESGENSRLAPSPLAPGLFAAETLRVVLSLGTREDRSH